MAYVSQELKKEIKAELDKVMPKDWKYSLSVRNHSTIVCIIKSAPIDLRDKESHTYGVNHYYIDRVYTGETLETMKKIVKALNHKNYDNSDIQSDYFDVGHYVSLNIGYYDKPFVVK